MSCLMDCNRYHFFLFDISLLLFILKALLTDDDKRGSNKDGVWIDDSIDVAFI